MKNIQTKNEGTEMAEGQSGVKRIIAKGKGNDRIMITDMGEDLAKEFEADRFTGYRWDPKVKRYEVTDSSNDIELLKELMGWGA